MRCSDAPAHLSCALAHSHWMRCTTCCSLAAAHAGSSEVVNCQHYRTASCRQSVCSCCQDAMLVHLMPMPAAAAHRLQGSQLGHGWRHCSHQDSSAASNEAPAGVAAQPSAATPAQPCQHNSSQLSSLQALRAGMARPADAEVTLCWHAASCRCMRSLHRPRKLHRCGWPPGNVGQRAAVISFGSTLQPT